MNTAFVAIGAWETANVFQPGGDTLVKKTVNSRMLWDKDDDN
jgi:hypothetical protein